MPILQTACARSVALELAEPGLIELKPAKRKMAERHPVLVQPLSMKLTAKNQLREKAIQSHRVLDLPVHSTDERIESRKVSGNKEVADKTAEVVSVERQYLTVN